MSRIGKIPVTIPAGVSVDVTPELLKVKGPKGEVTQKMVPGVTVTVEENQAVVNRKNNSKQHRALHGLYRSLLSNMVVGVTEGYERKLRIVGTGYRVELKGKSLEITAGFCHPVTVEAPEGVEFDVPKSTSREYMDFIVRGQDKQKVMAMAAQIRKIRTPDLYKGKGIRYFDETPRRLEGKSFGSA